MSLNDIIAKAQSAGIKVEDFETFEDGLKSLNAEKKEAQAAAWEKAEELGLEHPYVKLRIDGEDVLHPEIKPLLPDNVSLIARLRALDNHFYDGALFPLLKAIALHMKTHTELFDAILRTQYLDKLKESCARFGQKTTDGKPANIYFDDYQRLYYAMLSEPVVASVAAGINGGGE